MLNTEKINEQLVAEREYLLALIARLQPCSPAEAAVFAAKAFPQHPAAWTLMPTLYE